MAAPNAAPDDAEMELWRQQQAAQAASNPILASMGPAAQVPGPSPPPPGMGAPPPAPMPEVAPPAPVEAPPSPPAASSRPILDTRSTSQTSEKLSKVQQDDFAQLDKIRADEQAAQDRLTGDQVKDAALERQAALDKQQAAEQAQVAKAQAVQEAQERRARAEALYQQKLEAFNGKEFHSYWSGRPAAAEVLADIGVALGAFGASGRGQNEALQILNSRVQQDFDVQKAQIEKAKDSVLMAKTGIADADQARAMALDDLEIKRNAAMQAIEARLVAGKTAQVGDRTLAEGEMKKAGFAKDIQERKERTTAGMATRTTSTSNYVNPAALELKAGARKEANKPDLAMYDPETGKYLGQGRNSRDITAATKTLESAQKARSAVLALQAFHEANPGRQWGAMGVGTPEYAELQGLRKDVVNAFASLYGNGGSDVKMKGDAFRLPKEGDLFAGQKHEAQIGHLMETIDSVKSGVLRARGIEPPTDAAKPPVTNPVAQPQASSAKLDLARQALSDSSAPAEVKAKAREILLAARAAGR